VSLGELAASRRTHKAFGPEPVPHETLVELLGLARLAPNHHLTQPWRFRVLGPEALARLKEAAGPAEALKLDRAPTLVVVSATQSGDAVQDEEDLIAAGIAAFIVLLAAHGRGLAGYWQTPPILRLPAGAAAAGVPEGEHFLGLLHLGHPRQAPRTPERAPLQDVRTYLD
jgi:nitroreductase